MSIRNQLIKLLDKPYKDGELKKFNSLLPEQFSEYGINDWFKGVIQSLFYRTHHKFLVIEKVRGFTPDITRDNFLRIIIPVEMMACYTENEIEDCERVLFSSLIVNLPEPKSKAEKAYFNVLVTSSQLSVKDSFNSFPVVDKKLSSFVFISYDADHVISNRACKLKLLDTDLFQFSTISMLDVWRELFHTYKIKRDATNY